MKIKLKILIPMILLPILTTTSILSANIISFSNYVDETMQDTISIDSSVVTNEIEYLKIQAQSASLYMVNDNGVKRAILNQDGNALSRRVKELQTKTNVDVCTITDREGIVIFSTNEPECVGGDATGRTGIKSALTGEGLTNVESNNDVRLSVCSSIPILNEHNEVFGVVSVGFRLDTNDFVDSLKEKLNCEVTVFLRDERIATTILKEDGTRGVGTKAASNVSEKVLKGETYFGKANILGRVAISEYTPLMGGDGDIIGMAFVGRYQDEKTNTIQSFLQSGVFIILALLLVAIPVILLLVKRIVSPIHVMVKAADDLAVGDVGINVEVNTKDEMSQLAVAFNRMKESVQKQTHIIKAIAEGDLTDSIESRSDKDLMNHAIASLLELNNEVFSKVLASTDQVNEGARQVASNSRILAEGVTEQAVSVEQLSNSLQEVDGKTKNNAEMAENAANLMNTIRDNAQKGSEQMGRMVASVKEIDEACQSINGIIKMIDDIAFQTNILALNAAVEAARAGERGKGFDVVAKEVRNLANRSAEAAKKSGYYIENSIAKAKLGVNIANESETSFQEILSGINECDRIVNEIATLSEQQSTSITQINIGINRIAQVVQQNSSMAEENAAAGEELNEQSIIMEQLVSRFHLREKNDD